MTIPTTPKRKLIEVALPLEAINKESAREKSIRHGHPSTLHLWWARRPLAACRAVLFASLVDDPSSHPDTFPTEEAQDEERQRLFRLIEELVKWENTTNEKVLDAARHEILCSTNGNPPPVLDPFAGGGSIPLEAQRLGLEAHASDLNPVAVLINKALIEIPPKFAGRAPVNPDAQKRTIKRADWRGAQGLAEDVRYYGKWMRDEAERRIGHLYPKATLPDGTEATVIAWLWARTVQCPNPACGAQMPLVSSFALARKAGKERYIEPIIDYSEVPPTITYKVRNGKSDVTGTVDRRGAKCVACSTHVPLDYIRNEGKSKRLGMQLTAVAAGGKQARIYLEAQPKDDELLGNLKVPDNVPETDLPKQALGFRIQAYGLTKHKDLFTKRQLIALTAFSDLIQEVKEKVQADLLNAPQGEVLKEDYAGAVATYLAFANDRLSQQFSTLCPWSSHPAHELVTNMFSRQAIPLVWDFGEINPFSDAASWEKCLDFPLKVLSNLGFSASPEGVIKQADAMTLALDTQPIVISTDPPYYDNIGYADLSDYFYIWLRRSLSHIYPELFGTLLVPKEQELIANPFRFSGNRQKAQKFFEDGLKHAFDRMYAKSHPDFPVTIYYAFKQEDVENEGGQLTAASTGWETMLEGLLKAGFQITGTLPIRTERAGRLRNFESNALASSIVLVCRPRPETAPTATRREFLTALRRELPDALRNLQQGSIAPVDLAQAAIGPGMAVYSRYTKVLESDGKAMPVRAALAIINTMLDEVLAEQEGEFDADTRWALAWFEQFGMNEGPYGDAETLSKAKNTAVSGMVEAGVVKSGSGKVRLLSRSELPTEWDPLMDDDVPVWEATQHLVKRLEESGEQKAAALLAQLGSTAEIARDLAYRLYSLCERKKWAQEALAYNALVSVWPDLTRLAANLPEAPRQAQGSMFGDA